MTPQNLSSPTAKLLLTIRSGIFFLVLLLTTTAISPALLLASCLPFSFRYQLTTLWVDIIIWSAKKICGLNYQVSGLENIPADTNAIILCKHQSAWETVALQQIFPPQVYVLKKSLLWLPLWGWAMATLKPIAINRKNQKAALRKLIEQGTARLKEGLWVVIFPEGTRTAPGEKNRFNAGGCLLAQRSGYPVIPVAHNAGEFWPRYSFLKYPGTIKVRIGPLIESQGRKANELNTEVEAWISRTMQEISPREKQAGE